MIESRTNSEWQDAAYSPKKLKSNLVQFIEESCIVMGPDISERYFKSPTGHCNELAERPLALVFPKTTYQLSSFLSWCNRHGQTVTPQGGMSGLVGGGCPTASDIVVSLERMNEIENINPNERTMTAQAGVILQVAQEYAAEKGFSFPVDIGARGTAMLGGMIATNAGGMQVLRYGMMRQNIMGLEVVLADGTVLSSLNTMLKDNAGYDLKHLFIGSEGTLGIVTRAVFRLNPASQVSGTALVGIKDFDQVVSFLRYLEKTLCGTLTTFEILWKNYYDFINVHCPSVDIPIPAIHDYYVLVESQANDPERDQVSFENALAHSLEQNMISNAVIATSERQRQRIWAVRENPSEGLRKFGPWILFDVSLQISDMNEFCKLITKKTTAIYPDATILVMGHLADGNLHLLIAADGGSTTARAKVDDMVYGEIARFGGSVSAEHGIGTLKKQHMEKTRTAAEIELMRLIKQTLDPHGILNTGKIL